jgi:hypothetical protein
MNRYKVRLALALLGCASAIANAQTESPQMGVKEDRPSTGSLIRKDVAWSTKIPLNRTYAELTTEQKDAFNKNYEPIAPGDEPPYPVDGLKPIVAAIIKGQEAYLAVGELRLLVTVGPDGKAKDVSAYGKVDNPGMAKFAASVLLLTKYKPAICKGSPCTMQFPFQLKLKVDQD